MTRSDYHPSLGRADGDAETSNLPVLNRLHDEWKRITIGIAELHEVRRWGLPGMPISSLDDVLDRCGYRPEPGRGDPLSGPGDDYLVELLWRARSEMLAARIVLQRILPPLCAVARRHTRTRGQRQELLDELVANAWSVICTFPVDRRQQRIASNLVRDITFETIVRPHRRRGSQELPTEHAQLRDRPDAASAEAIDEIVEILHDALNSVHVTPEDVAFICQLINHGKPERLAVTLDVSARTVRNRRDAVVHRLRAMLAETAAAA